MSKCTIKIPGTVYGSDISIEKARHDLYIYIYTDRLIEMPHRNSKTSDHLSMAVSARQDRYAWYVVYWSVVRNVGRPFTCTVYRKVHVYGRCFSRA